VFTPVRVGTVDTRAPR